MLVSTSSTIMHGAASQRSTFGLMKRVWMGRRAVSRNSLGPCHSGLLRWIQVRVCQAYGFFRSNHAPNIRADLTPVLGFSGSNKASILTGTDPSVHDVFTHWGHIEGRVEATPRLYSIGRIVPYARRDLYGLPLSKIRILFNEGLKLLLMKLGTSATEWFMSTIPDDVVTHFTRLSTEIHMEESINGVQTFIGILRSMGVECSWHEIRNYAVPELELRSENTLDILFIPLLTGGRILWAELRRNAHRSPEDRWSSDEPVAPVWSRWRDTFRHVF